MNKLFICFVCFCLIGCHVGERYNPDMPLSDDEVKEELHLSQSPQNISQDWYSVFNDEDLNTLLMQVLKNNFTIQQGIERLQQARYNYLIFSKQNFPMFDGSFAYNFQKYNSPRLRLEDENMFQTGFDVSWELDIWGKGQYVSEQYYELVKNTRYSLLQILVTTTAETASTYIMLRTVQEKLRIAQKNLELQKEIYQTIKDKYDSGTVDDLALNQAQYAIENTSASIPLLHQQIEACKNKLAVLLGVTKNDMIINLDKYNKNIVSSAFKYSVNNLYSIPADVVRLRPDVMMAETKVRTQNAAVNEAFSNLFPTLSLSAAFGYLSSSGHLLFNSDSQQYGYKPVLDVPLWHWGQLKNNVELQKHIKNEYVQNYNEVFLTALSEIKNAIIAIEQAYKTNAHRKQSFNKMKNIMTLTQEKYNNGLVDFTDVATAEQDLLTQQLNLAESNADILQNLISFYKAVGGGYNFKP